MVLREFLSQKVRLCMKVPFLFLKNIEKNQLSDLRERHSLSFFDIDKGSLIKPFVGLIRVVRQYIDIRSLFLIDHSTVVLHFHLQLSLHLSVFKIYYMTIIKSNKIRL